MVSSYLLWLYGFLAFGFIPQQDSVILETDIEMPTRGLCAHRGAMGTHPENTLAAFQQAIDMGAHMIEFDVQLTKDNELVIMHDKTINRTTNGKGKVSDYTLAEIKALDAGSWKSAKFKGERIPTLAETLEMMPLNVWLNVHIKGDGLIGKLVAEEIVKQNRQHQAFLACGPESAKAAKRVSSDMLICNMGDQRSPNWLYANITVRDHLNFLQFLGEVDEEYEDIVDYLKDNDVQINYCCTDDVKVLTKLFNYGVQFPLVNDITTTMGLVLPLGIRPNTPVYKTE